MVPPHLTVMQHRQHRGPGSTLKTVSVLRSIVYALQPCDYSTTAVIDQEELYRDGPTIPQPCDHRSCRRKCWEDYPHSRFPNWTKGQVEKCGISGRIRSHDYHTPCKIYLLDINKQGAFKDAGVTDMRAKDLDNKWNSFNRDVKVRSVFECSRSSLTSSCLAWI
jgi:hypothetical protein